MKCRKVAISSQKYIAHILLALTYLCHLLLVTISQFKPVA